MSFVKGFNSRRYLSAALSLLVVAPALYLAVGPRAFAEQQIKGTTYGSGGYPRIVRLENPDGSAQGQIMVATSGKAYPDAPSPVLNLYKSSDNGINWSFFKTVYVPDTAGVTLHCCSDLFVLQHPVGNFGPGTLFLASTYDLGPNSGWGIGLFTSIDQGDSWQWHGIIVSSAQKVTNGKNTGVWEPEFSRDQSSPANLIMYFSDERNQDHSQYIQEMKSSDGIHFGAPTPVVTDLNTFGTRPGMPRVSVVPSTHKYLMTYEVINGPAGHAQMRAKTSDDGWNWQPSGLGDVQYDGAGDEMGASPFNRYDEFKGVWIAGGRQLLNPDGTSAQGDGKVLWMKHPGDANWTKIVAPVQFTSFGDNTCQNYSSDVLPGTDGTGFREVAGDIAPDGTCSTFTEQDGFQLAP